MPIRLASLHRYPVKGLSPEPLAEAALVEGGYFPGDRLFAVENGPSGFRAGAPEHQPKIKYLMLMRNERLARLETRYDDAARSLHIAADGRALLAADLSTPEGRAAVGAFFDEYCRDELRGPAKLLEAPPSYRFTDSRGGFVSLINLASVADLGARVGRDLDPLRFRGNLYFGDWPAWTELDLVGRRLRLGGAEFEVLKRIERCAATNVDPKTGARDLDLPAALLRAFGHRDCGIYARIVAGGRVRPGDELVPLD